MRATLLAAVAAGLDAVDAIATISAKGAKFFTSDGNQFFVKGIAYQLLPDDPLIDNTQCGLDAKLMKSIGTNSIRVYHVDPSGDHDDCMKTFEDAGIYVWLDLDTFDTQIEQVRVLHWQPVFGLTWYRRLHTGIRLSSSASPLSWTLSTSTTTSPASS